MNKRMCSPLQRPPFHMTRRLTGLAMQGMVMLELQFAILILGVGVAANLSIQTHALQRMIDTAQQLEAALLHEEAVIMALGSCRLNLCFELWKGA